MKKNPENQFLCDVHNSLMPDGKCTCDEERAKYENALLILNSDKKGRKQKFKAGQLYTMINLGVVEIRRIVDKHIVFRDWSIGLMDWRYHVEAVDIWDTYLSKGIIRPFPKYSWVGYAKKCRFRDEYRCSHIERQLPVMPDDDIYCEEKCCLLWKKYKRKYSIDVFIKKQWQKRKGV